MFKCLGDKGMNDGDKNMSLDKHCADGSSGKENQLVKLVVRITGGVREFLAVGEWRPGMLNPLQRTGQTLYKKN